MSNSITASVSESFELTVSPSEGFTGEHNAEMLEINISPLIQGGYDYYVIIFDDTTVNGVRKSNEIRGCEDYPAHLDNETVFCPLSAQLTSTGRLRFQLEAHKIDGESSVIKKTSVAKVEFGESIVSTDDSEFDAVSLSRLDELEKNLKKLDNSLTGLKNELVLVGNRIEELKIIPLATAESVGGIRIFSDSPVQLNENGAADLKISYIDSTNAAAKLILELLTESGGIKTLYVSSCDEVGKSLDALTFDLNVGTISCVLFYTEKSGTALYCDGNYNSVGLNANTNTIYVFTGQEDTFTITEYSWYSFRKLLLEGVK